MNLKDILSNICLIFILATINYHGYSQQQKKISIQGFLKDANGKAVADGQQNVTFKLYTKETGGTLSWTEDQQINVFGGVYSTYLGKTKSLDTLNWGANTYFVGITVQGTELTPRTELTFAPYSLGSPKAQEVVCSGAVGDIKYSILNPTEFAKVNGNCWVPMDGRALKSTDKLSTYIKMTNIPDGSGVFIRSQEFTGKADRDPDRDANSSVATLQVDSFLSHKHNAKSDSSGNHTHTITDPGHSHIWNNGVEQDDSGNGGSFREYTLIPGPPPGDVPNPIRAAKTNISINESVKHTHPIYIDNEGGKETRPKNLNFYIYIRIN